MNVFVLLFAVLSIILALVAGFGVSAGRAHLGWFALASFVVAWLFAGGLPGA